MAKKEKTDYTNIVMNLDLPFDFRRTKLLLGSLEYIAAEVVVAKIVRKIIKADTKGWMELVYVHALSLPFMGGAAALFDGNNDYEGKDKDGKEVGFGTHLMDGAKGIPAVLIAQYVLESFAKGFHVPWFNLKDLLITAGTKAITRPVVGFIFEYLPDDAKLNLRVFDNLVQRQREKSTLKSKPK